MEQQQSDVSLPLQQETDIKATTTMATAKTPMIVGAEMSSSTTITAPAPSIITHDPPLVRVRWIDAVWNAIGRLIAQKGINEFSRHELIRGYVVEIMAQSWSTTGTPTRAIIGTMNDLLALGRIVPCQSKTGKYMVAPCHLLSS